MLDDDEDRPAAAAAEALSPLAAAAAALSPAAAAAAAEPSDADAAAAAPENETTRMLKSLQLKTLAISRGQYTGCV